MRFHGRATEKPRRRAVFGAHPVRKKPFVALEGDTLLTIRGQKKFERKEEKEGDYRVSERSYGVFSRSMTLPFAVDPDAVEANFRNGLPKLTLPKPPEAQTRTRRIAINKS
jgi:HSP20 family protein